MKTKLTKLWSFLLSLVMLLSLLPTTALAATYYDRVKVHDILLENGHYLASNSSTSAETGANTEPTTYVAWYKGGVLTLKGYNGKGIETQGVAAGERTDGRGAVGLVDGADVPRVAEVVHHLFGIVPHGV